MLGKNLFGLDIGLPLHRLRERVRECIEGNSVDAVLVPATNRRGQSIDCRVSFSPLGGGNGDARGAILFMEDGSHDDGKERA